MAFTIPDRVAGLLLLYAQRIATITQLAVDDIHDDGDTVAITFGRVPITLPEPLAIVVRMLAVTLKGGNIITARRQALAIPWQTNPEKRERKSLFDTRSTCCEGKQSAFLYRSTASSLVLRYGDLTLAENLFVRKTSA